jgi:soluble lytic murein transglycosylase-like protein
MTEVVGTPERRTGADRRADGAGSEGRRERKQTSMLVYALHSLAIVVVLLFVIIFAVRHTRPVYASRGTVVEELRKRAPVAAAVIAPMESSTVARLMASPKYQEEKRNFYEDLMRTGRLDSARADSIAQYAVREAYTRGISPAIVFGVMLTENARFISNAMSNVGAVGLMQVYPKIWLKKEFSDSLGKDLASDSTNLKYGLFILDQYFHPHTKGGGTSTRDYRTALLRYNGCVTGSNTPHCANYPDKVRRYIEASAQSICDGRGFYDCIAKPFIAGLMGDDPNRTP